MAFERFPAEAILLLNPDARLLSGALARMQATLFSREHIGAVSPRIFWDSGLRFQLPPSLPPTLFEFDFFLQTFGALAFFPGLKGWLWRRHAVRIWKACSPIRVGNLSGGAVLLKSSAVKAAGGLFDPRFFLYFEDTDLFVRLRKAGFSLLMEPRAGAVHHYDQCGKENPAEKRHHMLQSHRLFVHKYHKPWKFAVKRLEGYLNLRPLGVGGNIPANRFGGDLVEGISVPLNLQKKWLFELSPDPGFIPAAGCMGSGSHMDFPEECRDLLSPSRYFFRFGDPDAFLPRLSSVATFEKTP